MNRSFPYAFFHVREHRSQSASMDAGRGQMQSTRDAAARTLRARHRRGWYLIKRRDVEGQLLILLAGPEIGDYFELILEPCKTLGGAA